MFQGTEYSPTTFVELARWGLTIQEQTPSLPFLCWQFVQLVTSARLDFQRKNATQSRQGFFMECNLGFFFCLFGDSF